MILIQSIHNISMFPMIMFTKLYSLELKCYRCCLRIYRTPLVCGRFALQLNNTLIDAWHGGTFQNYPPELEIKDTTESKTSASYLDLLPILTLLPNFGGFHRTLQRMRLANRGRLLLRTPGPVPFGTCICSNVETILS